MTTEEFTKLLGNDNKEGKKTYDSDALSIIGDLGVLDIGINEEELYNYYYSSINEDFLEKITEEDIKTLKENGWNTDGNIISKRI